ncbi:MAG: universal stress protein [Lewinellaceae bacterium]|nr:universal stress protein [Lewinellaceae bacterium]
MKTIAKILFPTDFSETAQNAFRYALILADHYGASLELVHAVYPEYGALDLPVIAAKATRDKLELAKEALHSFTELGITQVQATYSFKHVPVVDADVEVGSPVGIITRLGDRDRPDMIIMGTRGEHNALEKTLGSVTTGVIEEAKCPVLVIPENVQWKTAQVVAYATDLSEADPYHVWKTSELLAPFNPILHMVHVHLDKEAPGKINFNELSDIFSTRVPALQVSFHEWQGPSVTEALEEFSETYEVDLLVMFAPVHGWVDRLFRRSETKRMALETKLPLLILKATPQGQSAES